MKRINFEDIIQVCIGSTILAIPIAFTEEAWKLGATLPTYKITLICITSVLLTACFIYYGVYEGNIKNKVTKFISRIAINYGLTLLTVTYILFLLDILTDETTIVSMISKIILVSFPASLSGALLDSFDKE